MIVKRHEYAIMFFIFIYFFNEKKKCKTCFCFIQDYFHFTGGFLVSNSIWFIFPVSIH